MKTDTDATGASADKEEDGSTPEASVDQGENLIVEDIPPEGETKITAETNNTEPTHKRRFLFKFDKGVYVMGKCDSCYNIEPVRCECPCKKVQYCS